MQTFVRSRMCSKGDEQGEVLGGAEGKQLVRLWCSSWTGVAAAAVFTECDGEAAVVSGLGAAAVVAAIVVDSSEGVRAPRER